MRFLHSDIDYGPQISPSAHLFEIAFETKCTENTETDFLLPFNPVVTDRNAPPSVAFIGLNAYCAEQDFPDAKKEPNFAAWCQDSYNPKLFNVMEIWRSLLGPQQQGPFYYTNFVKLVLREDLFKNAKAVEERLYQYPDCGRLFETLAISEVEQLKANGCNLFICFGWAVYNRMCPVAHTAGVNLMRERHFAWYTREHTKKLIEGL